MEDDARKVPESEFSGNISGELRALLAVSDDEEGGEWLSDVPIKEELVEEVMQELWKEINFSKPENSPGLFFSSENVGGNKESCGPSYSDSASTLMAGIDGDGLPRFSGINVEAAGGEMGFPAEAGSGWPVVEGSGGGSGGYGMGLKGLGEEMDGCDAKEGDDEWLTRFLRWGQQ